MILARKPTDKLTELKTSTKAKNEERKKPPLRLRGYIKIGRKSWNQIILYG
jgi:hypothetical protein